jgi:hypothetical protein
MMPSIPSVAPDCARRRCALVVGLPVLFLIWGAYTSAKGQQKPDAVANISVSGHLSRTPVRNGDSVRFWITVENDSAAPIERIRLDRIDPIVFAQLAGSLSVSPSDACKVPAAKSRKGDAAAPAAPEKNEICAYLGPRESFTACGDLRASDSVERQNAFAIVDWQSHGGPSAVAVPLGEIESLSTPRWIWYSLLHDWELGVPTFTAFFGGLIALWKWRRDKQSRKQRELDDVRSKTWNLMLRDSHRITFKYYVPIGNGLSSAREEIKRYQSTIPQDPNIAQSALLYLLKFHWEMRRTARELGGYYFKNRTAEVLAEYLHQEHRRLFGLKNAVLRRVLDRCLDLMSPIITLDTLAGMIQAQQPDILAFWNHVLPWLSSQECLNDLPVLDGYLGVLLFEANRPYEHWYGANKPLVLPPDVRATVALIGWKNRIGAETDKYLEEASQQGET